MNLTTEAPRKRAPNAAENVQERIDWIKHNFPEAMTCDPYRSAALIESIRSAMLAYGFYKPTRATSNFASDETIIRYILKAQNKKVLSYKKPSKERIYSGW